MGHLLEYQTLGFFNWLGNSMLKLSNVQKLIALFIGAVSVLAGSTVFAADSLDKAIEIEKSMVRKAAASQKKIDGLSEQTEDLLSKYVVTVQRTDSLKLYNRELEQLIQSQEKEMVSITEQMASIDDTQRGLSPLMNRMIDALEQFVKLDLPFYKEKREEIIQGLKTNMLRADISTGSKYDQILRSYKREIEYGSAIETWDDENENGDVVHYLHIGRIAYVYLTNDYKEAYRYNASSDAWERLDDEYILALKYAVGMAEKTKQTKLIKVPVMTPEAAQ